MLRCRVKELLNEVKILRQNNLEQKQRSARVDLDDNIESSSGQFDSKALEEPEFLKSSSSDNVLSAVDGAMCTKCSSSVDWDRQSVTSSQSEMSVQILQDRYHDLQENHYSTNEELQAVYMELTDLQGDYEALRAEKNHLEEEKAVLFESFKHQTEKLEATRRDVANLRVLLQKRGQDEGHSFGEEEKEKALLQVLESIGAF